MQHKTAIEDSLAALRGLGIINSEIGIILGTGLGGLISDLQVEKTIEYSAIPNFSVATVETHAGKLVQGKLSGRNVIVMNGRFHYYEGYSMQQITFPLYVMKELGVRILLISNAAGNLNLNWRKGELMMISDHINLLPDNPLRGKNDNSMGPRFPDMSCPYNQNISSKLEMIAKAENIVLRKGVYASVTGPNLETRAEYKYLRIIGADAVGMSTVPEVIAANYLGMKVCAVSVLTDDCDPDSLAVADISEIIRIASEGEEKLRVLFRILLRDLDLQ